eukprot:scaffold10511_cov129-Isochrysis_galbana.AAC.3
MHPANVLYLRHAIDRLSIRLASSHGAPRTIGFLVTARGCGALSVRAACYSWPSGNCEMQKKKETAPRAEPGRCPARFIPGALSIAAEDR